MKAFKKNGYFPLLIIFSILFFQCKQNSATRENNQVDNTAYTTDSSYLTLSVMQIDSLRAHVNDYYLLDVRAPKETDLGKIPGAVAIDFYGKDFKSKISALDTGRTYLVYCRTGNRSAKTARIMTDLGFPRVINLDGGYKAYSETN